MSEMKIAAGLLAALSVAGCSQLTAQTTGPVQFQMHEIYADKQTYQALVVDVNADGRPDIVPGYPSPDVNRLVWYENPTWEEHLISDDMEPRLLWITQADLDGDSIPELAVAAGFSPEGLHDNTGELYLLESGGDLSREWQATLIDRLPLNHRIEFADVADSGDVVLLAAPVTGGESESYPVYAGETHLYQYNPAKDWQRTIVHTQTGHMHGMIADDWNGDGAMDILTAGLEGLWLHQAAVRTAGPDGPLWHSTHLAPGAYSLDPFGKGSSDVRIGHLANGQAFLVAPEPWHSGEIFVYHQQNGELIRYPVEMNLDNAHGPATGDLNGDGLDEIVLGNRTGDTSVYVYYATNASGTRWQREVVDQGGLGGTNCTIVDLNLDSRNDIVCGGHFTGNLRWYENLGPALD